MNLAMALNAGLDPSVRSTLETVLYASIAC